MASQSENSVSVELGELLELLNALEAQDNRPLENFATLERLLAAGKGGAVGPSSEDHLPHGYQAGDFQREDHQPEDHQSYDLRSDGGVGDGISDAPEQSSSDELAAHRLGWDEEDRREDDKGADERPEAEIENRLAVHIIQGLRKSMKDWAS